METPFINNGICASSGIGIGKILLWNNPSTDVFGKTSSTYPLLAKSRLTKAIESSKIEILSLIDSLKDNEAQIFQSHLLMLEDPELLLKSSEKIEKENFSAEFAYSSSCEEFIQLFESMDNDYMK